MAENTIDIAGASQDLQTIEDFVNLPAGSDVRPRLLPSVNVGTLAGTRDAIFRAGGLPAEPFATKALMTASILANGDYAMVTDDTVADNNGLYVKEGGAWVSSAYQPVMDTLNGTPVDLSTLPIVPIAIAYSTNSVRWERDAVRYPSAESYLLPVNSGDSFYVEAQANNGAYVTFIGSGIPTAGSALYNTEESYVIAGGSSAIVTAPPYAKNLVIRKRLTSSATNTPVKIIKKIDGKSFSSLLNSPRISTSLDQQFIDYNAFNEVKKQVEALTLATNTFMPISDLISGGFVEDSNSLVESTDTTIKSFELSLVEGDTLTFEYLPFDGVVLWIWKIDDYGDGVMRSYPMLSRGSVSTVPVEHTFRATQDMTVRLTSAVASSIKINGVLAEYTALGNWVAVLNPVYTTRGANNAYSFNRISNFIKVRKGDRVKIGTMPLGGAGLIVLNFDTYQFETAFSVPFRYKGDRSLDWVAEKDCYIRVGNNSESEISIKKAGTFVPEDKLTGAIKPVESGAAFSDFVPENIQLPSYKSTVFATSMNFILKTEKIGGVEYIMISQDLGKTWSSIENIIGQIVHYHFFADGTIMLCSPQKVYWTDDYLTLNESTVLDHDGSVFAPTERQRHFFAMQNSDKVHMTPNGEMFVWGDYTLSSTARLWYTIDRGRTIKAAAKFGTTIMDGEVRNVRHVHRTNYRTKDGYWYITTGDHGTNGSENMVLRAAYDWDTDTWSWKFYNSGWEFKFGAIFFDDVYAYLITDYTNDELIDTKQGMYRVLPEFLGDYSKYQPVFLKPKEDRGAYSRYLMDRLGNKIILPDGEGYGTILLAREGFDFKKITFNNNTWLAYIIGPNYNGDIYCVAYDNVSEAYNDQTIHLTRGTYNLTELLRDAGVSNFMKGDPFITDTAYVLLKFQT